MGRSVRISEEAALNFARAARLGCSPDLWARRLLDTALARLDRIPKAPPKKKPTRCRRCNQDFGGTGCTPEKCEFAPPTRSRKPSKEEKRDETSVIRAACYERAAGVCECGCGRPAHHDAAALRIDWNAQAELDHFFGRGKVKQSVETCWILRADCHREKTNNRPDALVWLQKFIGHCQKHLTRNAGTDPAAYSGYRQAAISARNRLRFVETRAALPAAPRAKHV